MRDTYDRQPVIVSAGRPLGAIKRHMQLERRVRGGQACKEGQLVHALNKRLR